MKYGIFSDVHANLEALEAVREAMARVGVDKYIFLGDVVGYGADPAACIKLLKDLQESSGCVCVAGNHDYAVADKTPTKNYSIFAVKGIEWTKKILSRQDKAFIAGWPLVQQADGITAVHANLCDPASWGYVLDIDDADPNFQLLKNQICFIGHSHRPIIFECGESVDWFFEDRFRLKGGYKYIVNTGSVGQPRDSDPRAAFVIYDTEEETVEIRRVVYDIAAAQQKIIKAGLPRMLADRLAHGK